MDELLHLNALRVTGTLFLRLQEGRGSFGSDRGGSGCPRAQGGAQPGPPVSRELLFWG